jgi:RNA polymerase sigma-70 factor, ECF subfamily
MSTPIPATMKLPTRQAEFEQRLAAHRGILVKIAASYTRDADDRADLVQEMGLELWRSFASYRPAQPFATWMYRVALNVAISHRRRRRGRGVEQPLDASHDALVGADGVDAEYRQQLAIVQQAMAALGALDRALLLLQLEGCSHRDSGEVLGLSAGNVATRLNRIRQQLRRSAGAALAITPGADDGNA